jgi:haloalkane dehalogenase
MVMVLVVLAAYLVGSLPAAWLAGKVRRVDLAREGSGNLGATNTFRVLGPVAGTAVLAFDVAKGLVAVLVLPGAAGGPAFEGLPVLAGVACVLGHVFPVWFGFRGGKGVATGAAVAFALAPWAAPVSLAAFLLVAGATRYISLASLTAAAVLPVAYLLVTPGPGWSPWVLRFCLGTGALVFVTHRGNLGRLVRGEERKWGAPAAPALTPDGWLDRSEYPFASHWFPTPAGRLHYLDEGTGDPVVFVHGNPSWSYEFRHLIRDLSKDRRCLAVDHLGFGLSDKPADWTYLPADHARNLALLLDALDLENVTLVVGDWGGPIGLSWALDQPRRVKALVVTNTWMWSVADDWYFRAFSGFVGGPVGRFLIRTRNFFVRDIFRAVFGDKKKLTPALLAAYVGPLARPADRKGNWTFPGQIIGASDWLESLWARRASLAEKPVLLAWGMKDIAFRKKELDRWIQAFPGAEVLRFSDAGHLVAEEKPGELAAAIRRLLGD